MDIDEADFRENNYEKSMKYDIIEMCGIKYKVIHFKSSSKNNKLLICLGQIKYFIKNILKLFMKCLIYLRDNYLKPLAENVYNIYGEDFIIAIGFMIFLLYPMLSILDAVVQESLKISKDFKVYKLIPFIFILIKKIVVTAITTIMLYISILLILYVLVKIWYFIIYMCKTIYNFFSAFYKQIPEVEELEGDQLL
jgi:hypothetical protein